MTLEEQLAEAKLEAARIEAELRAMGLAPLGVPLSPVDSQREADRYALRTYEQEREAT